MALLTTQHLENFRRSIFLPFLKACGDAAYQGDLDNKLEIVSAPSGTTLSELTDNLALLPLGQQTAALQKEGFLKKFLAIKKDGEGRNATISIYSRGDGDLDDELGRTFKPEFVKKMMRQDEVSWNFSHLMNLLDHWDRGVLGIKNAEGKWLPFDPTTAMELSADGHLHRYTTPDASEYHKSTADLGEITQLEETTARKVSETFFQEFDFGSIPSDIFGRVLALPASEARKAIAEKRFTVIDVKPLGADEEGGRPARLKDGKPRGR